MNEYEATLLLMDNAVYINISRQVGDALTVVVTVSL